MRNFVLFWIKLGDLLFEGFRLFLVFLVRLYQVSLGLWIGGSCRFEPTCSEYAVEALKKLPILDAILIIFRRILRCRPGSNFGMDPVPAHISRSCCGGPHGSR